MARTLVRWLPVLLILLAIFFAASNAQAIKDWYTLRNYTPNATIEALARDTSMSDEGERLFFVSQPELNDRAAFNSNCPFPERTLVLGCYSGQRIYIFDVDDPRLAGVEEVTAAHEMLHAVFERLSDSKKSRISELLISAWKQLDDKRLNETVQEYQDNDPASVNNELHSILGTEHHNLGAELEEHYAQYFDDRQVIVAISEDYEAVFEELQDEIAKLDKQIQSLRNQITGLEETLESMSSFLESEAQRLDDLLDSNNIGAYNAAVPGYNGTVNEFNRNIDQYQRKVDQHNNLVEKRNSIAVEQNSLVQSLDSKFSPIDNE